MIEIPVLKDDDPEVRKEAQIYTSVVKDDVLEPLMTRYSSWWKLKVTVAWLLRYNKYLQIKVQLKKKVEPYRSDLPLNSSELPLMEYRRLKVAELQEAEREILKKVQQTPFPDVTDILSSTRRES